MYIYIYLGLHIAGRIQDKDRVVRLIGLVRVGVYRDQFIGIGSGNLKGCYLEGNPLGRRGRAGGGSL